MMLGRDVSQRTATLLSIVLALLPAASAVRADDGKDLRILVKDSKVLFKKVVVQTDDATLHETPDPNGTGEKIGAFLVFYKLTSDDGREEVSGFSRIGDSGGKPIGWIKKEHLLEWNTRFVLYPNQVGQQGVSFVIYDDKVFSEGSEYARLKKLPAGHYAICPVLEKPTGDQDDLLYHVAFFMGQPKISTEPTAGNPLEDLKLEICFVIDTTASMMDLIEATKQVAEICASTLGGTREARSAVRFALVEYRDKTPGIMFAGKPSHLVSSLTDAVQFKNRLQPLQIPLDGNGNPLGSEEAPEDVIAGLKMAIDKAGWSKNSSKHIILLGDASAHTPDCPRTLCAHGGQKASTAMSVQQIINHGRPVGGEGESGRQLLLKNFHAVRADQPGEDADQDRCHKQFKRITENNDDFKGLLTKFDPDTQKPNDIAAALADLLEDTYRELRRIRSVDPNSSASPNASSANPFTEGIYKILKTRQGGESDPLDKGWAKEYDRTKDEKVATVKILVAREELFRLEGTLHFLYSRLAGSSDPRKRGTVPQLVEVLKLAAVGTAAGQQLGPDTNLADLISDLPLRTQALETSAQDLAEKSKEDFEVWLTGLKASRDRARQLLDPQQSKDNWWDLSGGLTEADEYTWLTRAEMP